jgi:hypothetical protein
MSDQAVDWDRIAEERLRLYAEATSGDPPRERLREIYTRLLELHLTPEDIDELIPGVFDSDVADDPVARLA